jgi:putative spermidine/putrescine transport system permease protein
MQKRGPAANIWRWSILIAVASYLLLPIASMVDFSTKIGRGKRGLYAWKAIPSQPDLLSSVVTSLTLAVIVMALLIFLVVPTVIWVHLKLPKLRRPIELICLLPLAIPGIVLVVGIAPLYNWISIHITESPLTLSAAYSILILPYSYRSLSAAMNSADIHTLAEAARTLGASTFRMLFGVIIPTIRAGVMSAAVISIALVLGEYTISSLLNYKTVQVQIQLLGQTDGTIAVAVSLASLFFVFLLLVVIPTTTNHKSAILDVDAA